MLILIDDANLEDVTAIWSTLPVDGVTTNPTILARQHRDPLRTLRELRELLGAGPQLHAQVVGTEPDVMVNEALVLRGELGEDLFVKIPVTEAGYVAMRRLSAQGVNVTATAIHAPMQAFLAAKAGARYVAPYINRLDNLGADGVRVAAEIQTLLDVHRMDTQLLAASFKNSQQITELAKLGAGAVTAAPAVLRNLFRNATTDAAVAEQRADLESVIGAGHTFADLVGSEETS
ncbi:transaldolase family protein [Propionibacterium australiense]|uniref:Fructose-6-phosphate aldolase n=1 Tax=Propionibacterium australiense TaxID=119981 RepID=A0A8B3FMZ1_9ACTN|nr:transaldolase family protein [Propionibacterium australiense]RLP10814.1 fructose-6-phosphate aldolase [Propionibacterium australiense]